MQLSDIGREWYLVNSKKMKKLAKPLIIFIVITFVGGALYMGGMSVWGGNDQGATVATVNGDKINEMDLLQAYYQDLQYYQSMYGQVTSSMAESIKYGSYDVLVYNKLIEQEIANRKIKADSVDVDQAVADFKEEYGQEVLDTYGYTDPVLRSSFTRQLQYEKLQELVASEVEVSEQDIKDAYEQVRSSHILFKVDDPDNETAWTAAKALADRIPAQLATMEFEEAAALYSDDSSASQGGDIGFVSQGATVDAYNDAIFSMAVGEISEPIKSEFGYHIIKVTDRKAAEGEEFEAEKESIRAELASAQKAAQFEEWLKAQRDKADIELLDNTLLAFESVLNDNYEDAVKYYQKAIEEEPDNGYLYASIAEAYASLEDRDAAIVNYEKAVELAPNDGELHLMLASLYDQNEQVEDATNSYLKASELLSYDWYMQYVIRTALANLEQDDAVAVVDERIAQIEEMYNQSIEEQADSEADLPEVETEETATSEEE